MEEDESKTVDGQVNDRVPGKDCPILGGPSGADGRLAWIVNLTDYSTRVHGIILQLAKQDQGMPFCYYHHILIIQNKHF